MKNLSQLIENEESYLGIKNAVDSGACPVLCSGVSQIHAANIIARLREDFSMPVLVVCSDELEAGRLSADVEGFCGQRGDILSDREFMFYSVEGASKQSQQRRLNTLYKAAEGKAELVFATVTALMQRSIPKKELLSWVFELKMGQEYDLDKLCDMLTDAGYERAAQVEGMGQFARRGGILDFYSPSMEDPVRCEFFGDEIDSMGTFDLTSQRRTEVIKVASIIPAAEVLPRLCPGGLDGLIKKLEDQKGKIKRRKNPQESLISAIDEDIRRLKDMGDLPSCDRYIDLIYEKASAAEMFEGYITVFYEPRRLSDRAKNYDTELSEDIKTLMERGVIDSALADFAYKYDNICEIVADNAVVMLDNFASGRYVLNPKTVIGMTAKQTSAYGGSVDTAARDIQYYMKEGYRTVVLCSDRRKAQQLCRQLDSYDIKAELDFDLTAMPEPGQCAIAVGYLSAGFEYPGEKIALITEGQILRQRKKVRKARHKTGQKLDSFADLTYGDLVVHEQYGIGRFMGIVKMPVDGKDKDYIKIAYAGTDKLYVPATNLDVVTKYIGSGEDQKVKLSRMGGTEWAKTKSRAKSAAKDLAKGLIELQAQRMKEIGYAFSPDTPWQAEFEDAFEYTETDDQLTCISEIKKDMEKPIPMDRLLCGDVGYGKTEVALRAVMKCVMDGKQAAILVPTTVLAQQHYVTVMKRFSGIPVRVEVLSRYRTQTQMKKALREIASGGTDIVIGTHRLLQKDISFKDLGLLVIDEEQRFGVSHKERLKEMSHGVDVLTLSATPIPRTLNMALSGIRDMSTIEEPPMDRQPVQTYVMEHDWGIICDAIRREVSRGGQVYYLHNRVSNIENTAKGLAEMLDGEVAVGVAHGQMDEASLNSVMEQMVNGDVQVLVCTTIIETGIDIPNVNTLIIEDADKMGLAQLHQIRGRVGRSRRKGYAYLTFRKDKVLTEIAVKRLTAIREFAEFNSGFKIAMRDLEIRGAGNLLGPEQSGHMMSVGYDMYLKILEEAVTEEKGEKPKKKAECSADLLVSAYIPQTYMPRDEERMDVYRRIAHVRTEEDADDIIDELVDRYGDIPKSVNMLIHIALLRGEASQAGISEITQKKDVLRFKIDEFDMKKISAMYVMPEYKNAMKVEAGAEPVVSVKIKTGVDVIKAARNFVRTYGDRAGEKDGETE